MSDTINYKINVDSSSIADQLQQVKNQIDQAMAQYTFKTSIPDPQPRVFSFPDGGGMGMSMPSPGGFYSPSVGIAAGQVAATGMTVAQQDALNFMQTARLGFHKFSQDAVNMALRTPMGSYAFQPPVDTPFYNINNIRGLGPVRSAFESFTNWGYDNSMAMSYGAYSNSMANNVGDKLPELLQTGLDWGGLATGIGWGAAKLAGWGSTATGLGLASSVLGIAGLSYTGLKSTFGYDISPALDAKAFIRDTSWRQLSGAFNSSDAGALGLQAATLQRGDDLVGRRVGSADVQRLISEFTDIGGFDFVRTAKEYSEKLRAVVESHKQVMNILRSSEQDALGALKDWQAFGLAPAANQAIGMSTLISSTAMKAGYTSAEMMQFGGQSAEAIRGTGIMMGAGYLGGMDALMMTKNMMATGAISQELSNQWGGATNIAATINRAGFQWGQSNAGLTHYAAQAFYGPLWNAQNANPFETMTGAVSNIRSISDWMNFKGSMPDRLSGESPESMYMTRSLQFLKAFDTLAAPNGVELNKNTFRTFMERNGVGVAEADLMFSELGRRTQDVQNPYVDVMNRMEMERYNNGTGWFNRLEDRIGNTIADVFHTRQIAAGFSNTGTQLSNAFSNIGRSWDAWVNGREYYYSPTYATSITKEKIAAYNIKMGGAAAELTYGKGVVNKTSYNAIKGVLPGDDYATTGDLNTSAMLYAIGSMESKLDFGARHKKGAFGAFQFLPSTWDDLKKRGLIPMDYADPKKGDVPMEQQVIAASSYLDDIKKSLGSIGNDPELVTDAWYLGAGAVKYMYNHPNASVDEIRGRFSTLADVSSGRATNAGQWLSEIAKQRNVSTLLAQARGAMKDNYSEGDMVQLQKNSLVSRADSRKKILDNIMVLDAKVSAPSSPGIVGMFMPNTIKNARFNLSNAFEEYYDDNMGHTYKSSQQHFEELLDQARSGNIDNLASNLETYLTAQNIKSVSFGDNLFRGQTKDMATGLAKAIVRVSNTDKFKESYDPLTIADSYENMAVALASNKDNGVLFGSKLKNFIEQKGLSKAAENIDFAAFGSNNATSISSTIGGIVSLVNSKHDAKMMNELSGIIQPELAVAQTVHATQNGKIDPMAYSAVQDKLARDFENGKQYLEKYKKQLGGNSAFEKEFGEGASGRNEFLKMHYAERTAVATENLLQYLKKGR